MANTIQGERLLAELRAAEAALALLDPIEYARVGHWLDKELFGALYGHGGGNKVPGQHLPQIRAVLRARAAAHRGRKNGAIAPDGEWNYDAEVGNEQMAQAIDACVAWLGEGDTPPVGRAPSWDDFWPKW